MKTAMSHFQIDSFYKQKDTGAPLSPGRATELRQGVASIEPQRGRRSEGLAPALAAHDRAGPCVLRQVRARRAARRAPRGERRAAATRARPAGPGTRPRAGRRLRRRLGGGGLGGRGRVRVGRGAHEGQRREGGQPRGERRRRRLVEAAPVGAARVELAGEIERRAARERRGREGAERRPAERRRVARRRRRRRREDAALRVVEEEARELLARRLEVVVVGLVRVRV